MKTVIIFQGMIRKLYLTDTPAKEVLILARRLHSL